MDEKEQELNQSLQKRASASKRKSAPLLIDLAGGAVQERFEEAWMQAVRNIADPNTNATKAREINIRVVLKPLDGNRAAVTIGSNVTTKLAHASPVTSLMEIHGVETSTPTGVEVPGIL